MEVGVAIAAPHKLHHHHHLQHQQQQPQLHIEQTSYRLKRKKLLSLENYLAFFRSRDHLNLNVDQLNQITSIHGFKKLKQRKDVMIETLEAINLIDLTRSTLNDNISSEAFLTFKEVIKDLGALNWQECAVTSIRFINSQNHTALPSEKVTKSKTPKTKKRSRSTPLAMSLSSGEIKSSPNESNSGSGSSKLALPATSSSSGNNGSSASKSGSGNGSTSLVAAEGGSGSTNGEGSKKRKSIKRILRTEAMAPTNAQN